VHLSASYDTDKAKKLKTKTKSFEYLSRSLERRKVLRQEFTNQRSVNGTPTQASLATLSVLPMQLKLWQKGLICRILRRDNVGVFNYNFN